MLNNPIYGVRIVSNFNDKYTLSGGCCPNSDIFQSQIEG